MWNLKYEINELTYETEADSPSEKRLEFAKWEGRRGKAGLEIWV